MVGDLSGEKDGELSTFRPARVSTFRTALTQVKFDVSMIIDTLQETGLSFDEAVFAALQIVDQPYQIGRELTASQRLPHYRGAVHDPCMKSMEMGILPFSLCAFDAINWVANLCKIPIFLFVIGGLFGGIIAPILFGWRFGRNATKFTKLSCWIKDGMMWSLGFCMYFFAFFPLASIQIALFREAKHISWPAMPVGQPGVNIGWSAIMPLMLMAISMCVGSRWTHRQHVRID